MAVVELSSRLPRDGVFVGRVRMPGRNHPLVVAARGGALYDITSAVAPTVRDVCEQADPAHHVANASGLPIGLLEDVALNSLSNRRDPKRPQLLSPIDLQAVKAAGVTFAASLLERVIDEQTRGDPERAQAVRQEIVALIGEDLSALKPGTAGAAELKNRLVALGLWSQYLEVGIGPDAEIFTKCQPMASVGFGADVGLHPISSWNNPEPEIVVIVSSCGAIVGATLGNDVNLRDVEGRSALLLGKAKDNNASAAIGPFIRLFDDDFTIADITSATVRLTVVGQDGFRLAAESSMSRISRTPTDLVAGAMGPNHQYPDGMALYLGTMFAPIQDRDEVGAGFTHKRGDVVTISTERLGALVNRVNLSCDCPPWTYGASHLLRDLSDAGLLQAATPVRVKA